jgi:FkbM family methyltransferase
MSETYEEAEKRVWDRIAAEYPEFTRDMDPYHDPYTLDKLLFGKEMQLRTFPGGNVLDIGANCGVLSAFWAAYGANVIAHEADPVTFNDLSTMLEKSGLLGKVHPINAAIWTRNGKIKFRGNGFNSEARTIRGGCLWVSDRPDGFYEDPSAFEVEVPCVSFNQALKSTVWDYVKMDIEGAEYAVLAAADLDKMKKQIKQMHLELHPEWADDEVYRATLHRLECVFEISGGRHSGDRYHWLHLKNKDLP